MAKEKQKLIRLLKESHRRQEYGLKLLDEKLVNKPDHVYEKALTDSEQEVQDLIDDLEIKRLRQNLEGRGFV